MLWSDRIMVYKIYDNVNGFRDANAEETIQIDKDKLEGTTSAQKKLIIIKNIRLQKLQETDFYALGDVTMSDAMKTYRQNLRDITINYADEAAYDLLLKKDLITKKLTHSIWSKP